MSPDSMGSFKSFTISNTSDFTCSVRTCTEGGRVRGEGEAWRGRGRREGGGMRHGGRVEG